MSVIFKKQNPYLSSVVGKWPFRSDLNSRTTGVSAATLTRTGTGHFRTGNGIISSKGTDVARFETHGLLLEQASTNALLHSDDIENIAWTLLGSATITPGQTDPKGGSTAFKIVAGGAAVFLQTTGVGTVNAVSMWMKCQSSSSLNVALGTAGGNTEVFTLTDSWKKYSYVYTEDGIIFGNLAFIDGDTFYIWNPQAEISAFSTTDIITSGITGTRSADLVSLPSGVVPNINNSFAIAADVIVRNAPASSMGLFSFQGETNGRIVTIANDLKISGSYGGSATLSASAVFTIGCRHRVLFTGNNSTWKIYVDGVQAASGSTGGSGSHTSIRINNGGDGVLVVRDVIGYNRYFSTASEAVNELKYH